ncbi:MAG: DNA repair protein RecO [bacterium]|jgi:DNA repair protein RecO|nr:DNA repair protein RecO [bacterium]
MPLLHTEAITLRRRRGKDADALVILYGKTSGKVTASTKSVMKTQSRYAGVTQPLNRIHAVLYAKNTEQEIWTLTQVALIQSYDTIQKDLTRLSYASCLMEWVDFLSHEFQSSYRVWTTMVQAFERWNEQAPCLEDLYYFQWRLLCAAGFQPEIFHCLHTKATEAPGWVYIPKEGGLVANTLGLDGYPLTAGTIQALRKLAASPTPPAVRLSPSQSKEIKALYKIHLEYHVGLRSRAELFLERYQS